MEVIEIEGRKYKKKSEKKFAHGTIIEYELVESDEQ